MLSFKYKAKIKPIMVILSLEFLKNWKQFFKINTLVFQKNAVKKG